MTNFESKVPVTTNIGGIFQSDIIIRTALVEGIRDLRRNPHLLDYAFVSLRQDELTKDTYGEKEATKAKKWFLSTDIPVIVDYRLDPDIGTCVVLTLDSCGESENILGDINYIPQESTELVWEPLTSKFNATSYDSTTGTLKIPESVSNELVIVPGMNVIDSEGGVHEIKSVAQDQTILVLAEPRMADFTNCFIKGTSPRGITELESLFFKETYRITINVHGDPFQATWLYSIILFILLRYKESLLEARGFGRSVINNISPFAKNEATGKENYWTRIISLSGYVCQSWPKDTNERLQSLGIDEFNYSQVNKIADKGFTKQPQQEDPPWMAQIGDGLNFHLNDLDE